MSVHTVSTTNSNLLNVVNQNVNTEKLKTKYKLNLKLKWLFALVLFELVYNLSLLVVYNASLINKLPFISSRQSDLKLKLPNYILDDHRHIKNY